MEERYRCTESNGSINGVLIGKFDRPLNHHQLVLCVLSRDWDEVLFAETALLYLKVEQNAL